MVSTQVLHTKWCDNVDCFLGEIDKLGVNQLHQTWLFRGQNRDWELLPSSLRCDFINRYVVPTQAYMKDLLEYRNRELTANENLNLYIYVQRQIEDLIVRRFTEVADRAHLYVPTDSKFALGGESYKIDWAELENAVFDNVKTYRDPTSVVDALAQHQRIPTRLLDWSYSPYVAAFFATDLDPEDNPTRSDDKRGPMVVWAINYTNLEDQNTGLTLVTQLRTRIGFLQAQDGVFLYDKMADKDFREKERWVSFEQKFTKSEFAGTYLKFTIPFTLRDTLRQRLRQYGVSEPTLMPSFDVVRKWTLDFYADHPEQLFWLSQ